MPRRVSALAVSITNARANRVQIHAVVSSAVDVCRACTGWRRAFSNHGDIPPLRTTCSAYCTRVHELPSRSAAPLRLPSHVVSSRNHQDIRERAVLTLINLCSSHPFVKTDIAPSRQSLFRCLHLHRLRHRDSVSQTRAIFNVNG